jgi:hypothetical protein
VPIPGRKLLVAKPRKLVAVASAHKLARIGGALMTLRKTSRLGQRRREAAGARPEGLRGWTRMMAMSANPAIEENQQWSSGHCNLAAMIGPRSTVPITLAAMPCRDNRPYT